MGILGGTFNPPHLGHLAVARHARAALALERVLLMPARIPPHKPRTHDPGPEHRLQMCRLLVAGSEGVSACALEIEREGPSYTVDTLRAIDASHPHAELTFIVGADTASTLPTWREPRELLGLTDLAVAARSGTERERVRDAVEPLLREALHERPAAALRFLELPTIEISSSLARERAAAGEPVAELVGDAVGAYILEHDLYRARAGARL